MQRAIDLRLTTLPADYLRMLAAHWERVAKMADDEGDKWHAADARLEAANIRQIAREREAETK